MPMMNGFGCGGWGIAGMGLGGLLGFLTLVAVVVLAGLGGAWLARRGRITHGATGGDTPAVRGDAARDRLRQRYAEGEMDEEEFERRLAALTSASTTSPGRSWSSTSGVPGVGRAGPRLPICNRPDPAGQLS
jgi:putative membrane protein